MLDEVQIAFISFFHAIIDLFADLYCGVVEQEALRRFFPAFIIELVLEVYEIEHLFLVDVFELLLVPTFREQVLLQPRLVSLRDSASLYVVLEKSLLLFNLQLFSNILSVQLGAQLLSHPYLLLFLSKFLQSLLPRRQLLFDPLLLFQNRIIYLLQIHFPFLLLLVIRERGRDGRVPVRKYLLLVVHLGVDFSFVLVHPGVDAFDSLLDGQLLFWDEQRRQSAAKLAAFSHGGVVVEVVNVGDASLLVRRHLLVVRLVRVLLLIFMVFIFGANFVGQVLVMPLNVLLDVFSIAFDQQIHNEIHIIFKIKVFLGFQKLLEESVALLLPFYSLNLGELLLQGVAVWSAKCSWRVTPALGRS